MKKRMKILLSVLVLSVLAVFASGCGNNWLEQLRCDHVWDDGKITVKATCTSVGERTFTCTECGKTETEEIEKSPHTETVVEAIPPTCTEGGWTSYTKCIVCNEEFTQRTEIPADGHVEKKVVGITATCSAKGMTDGKICSVCGEVLLKQEEIPALNHNVITINGYAATCTKEGVTNQTECTLCGEVFSAHKVIPALGHTLVSHAAKAATCTSVGWNAYETCENCDYTTYQEILKLSHTEVLVEAVSATCETTGYTSGKKCGVCGTTLVGQTLIPALGHTEVPLDGRAATCEQVGLTDGVKCGVCGKVVVKQSELPALGHIPTVDEAVAATCEKTGLSTGSHCERCGETLSEQQPISALGHNLTTYAAKVATCLEKGWKEYQTCSRCDYTTYEEIPALGHKFIDGACVNCGEADENHEHAYTIKETLIAATCTTAGLEKQACACGVSQEVEISAFGHTEEILEGKAVQCMESGLTEGKQCSVCGEVLVEQETIEAPGHTFDDGTATKTATCTTAGEILFSCAVCDVSYTEEVSALGHMEVFVSGNAATCSATGLTDGTKCSVCNAVLMEQEEIAVDLNAHAYGSDYNCTYCGESGIINGTELESGVDLTGYTMRLNCSEDEFKAICNNYSGARAISIVLTVNVYDPNVNEGTMVEGTLEIYWMIGGIFVADNATEKTVYAATLATLSTTSGTVNNWGRTYELSAEHGNTFIVSSATGGRVVDNNGNELDPLSFIEFLPPLDVA